MMLLSGSSHIVVSRRLGHSNQLFQKVLDLARHDVEDLCIGLLIPIHIIGRYAILSTLVSRV
jgi:hypothetical protein